MPLVPLFCPTATRQRTAEQLVTLFSLTRVLERPTEGHWLELGAERLTLETTGKRGSVCAEFIEGAANYRREHGGGRSQPIVRALGLKSHQALPYVLDATAGLGRDAFVLACVGCRVTLVERSPVAAALLADALDRALAHPNTMAIASRMNLVHADANEWLPTLATQDRPDVIFLDPMFPTTRRRSMAKKDMQAFQQVVGEDNDAAVLLTTAIDTAIARVVVKRPRLAPPMANLKPSGQLIGQSTRFDLYSIKALRLRLPLAHLPLS